MKKVLIIGLLCLASLGVFSGCKEKGQYMNLITVTIKVEYKEQFIAQELDFNWANIKTIRYTDWYIDSSSSYENRLIHITFKNHSNEALRDASKHLKTLPFVEKVSELLVPNMSIY